MATATNYDLLELIEAVANMIDVYDQDIDESEWVEHPETINRLRTILPRIRKVLPTIKVVEELILGDITPLVFNRRMNKIDSDLVAEEDKVGNDVKTFLDGLGKGEK